MTSTVKRVILFPLLFLGLGCHLILTEEEFELPAAFNGWVEVEVENPRCPPVQRRGSTLVVAVGNDGTACTSEKLADGWSRTRMFYRDQAHTELFIEHQGVPGTVRLLSGVGTSGGIGARDACRSIEFFVGPSSQLNQLPRPHVCFRQ